MTLPDRAALGTMHGKAAAIAPPLTRLGITLVVPEGLDTDRFGTFTGETPRAGTMEEAARAKARAAIAVTGLSVGIASEGAYGPHPAIPFIPYGRELILWRNEMTGQEIVEWLGDNGPTYDHAEADQIGKLEGFLASIDFPRTALIVAPAGLRDRPVAKGVADHVALAQAIAAAAAASPEGLAFVQTDMRAHMNPRRMAMIGQLAARLAARLAQTCPACHAPGWGLLRVETGLPCTWCDGPTLLVKADVHGCTLCRHEVVQPRVNGPSVADPGQCPACNP